MSFWVSPVLAKDPTGISISSHTIWVIASAVFLLLLYIKKINSPVFYNLWKFVNLIILQPFFWIRLNIVLLGEFFIKNIPQTPSKEFFIFQNRANRVNRARFFPKMWQNYLIHIMNFFYALIALITLNVDFWPEVFVFLEADKPEALVLVKKVHQN